MAKKYIISFKERNEEEIEAQREKRRNQNRQRLENAKASFLDFVNTLNNPFTIWCLTILGGMALIAGVGICSLEELKLTTLIEDYVEQNDNVSNFSSKAITAIQKEDKYMLKIYGSLEETTEGKPVFSSILYETDEETYKLVNDSCDISYEFGAYNQVINAENSFKKDILAVYRKVAEITKNQQPVEIEKYSPNEMAETSAQKFAPVEVEVSYTSADGKVKYNQTYGGINVAMPEM